MSILDRSHYEDYPYPPSRTFRTPLRRLRHPSWPNVSSWREWFPSDEQVTRKRVLVVGCGTEEAVLVAAQEPMLDVIGIDHSLASVESARGMAEREKIRNVKLMHAPLCIYAMRQTPPFDVVLCHGVLHHIAAADSALEEMREMSKLGAALSVMVYGSVSRGFIPAFCSMLRLLGLGPNADGVGAVRDLMCVLSKGHPAREFFDATDRSDAQIADLWLHPYFRQYRASELVSLVERHGFRFQRWTTPDAVSIALLEQVGGFSDVLAAMTPMQRADVGQVLNQADSQLGAMFEAV